jgi:hypothetical protein
VVDHGLRAVAVVALFGWSVVVVAIHHGHHKGLLLVGVGVVLVAALAEGAYEVWNDAARELSSTRAELTRGASREATAARLDALAEEMRLLVNEAAAVPQEEEDQGYGFNDIAGSCNHIQEKVRSELRMNAPEWLTYFSETDSRSDPKSPDYDPHYLWHSEGWVSCLSFSEHQIRHISSELRKISD